MSANKIIATVFLFCGRCGKIHIDWTINVEYYANLLGQLNHELGYDLLPHSPYSLELAPTDYFPFSNSTQQKEILLQRWNHLSNKRQFWEPQQIPICERSQKNLRDVGRKVWSLKQTTFRIKMFFWFIDPTPYLSTINWIVKQLKHEFIENWKIYKEH